MKYQLYARDIKMLHCLKYYIDNAVANPGGGAWALAPLEMLKV